MSLSKEILSFLNHLDLTAQSFDADYLEGLFPPDEELSTADLVENRRLMNVVALAASLVIESRTGPITAAWADISESLDQVWYLSSCPELMGHAARQLEKRWEAQS